MKKKPVLCAYTEFKNKQQQTEAARERLDECIRELIRISIEEIDQREPEPSPCCQRIHTFFTGLYYLSYFGKLTHPAKHDLAWKVLTEFQQYHKAKLQRQESDTL